VIVVGGAEMQVEVVLHVNGLPAVTTVATAVILPADAGFPYTFPYTFPFNLA